VPQDLQAFVVFSEIQEPLEKRDRMARKEFMDHVEIGDIPELQVRSSQCYTICTHARWSKNSHHVYVILHQILTYYFI